MEDNSGKFWTRRERERAKNFEFWIFCNPKEKRDTHKIVCLNKVIRKRCKYLNLPYLLSNLEERPVQVLLFQILVSISFQSSNVLVDRNLIWWTYSNLLQFCMLIWTLRHLNHDQMRFRDMDLLQSISMHDHYICWEKFHN